MSWYYTFSKFKVEPSNIPEKPHYAALVFWDHRYSEPAWDKDDSPTSAKIKTVDYYAFFDRTSWEEMISTYYLEKSNEKRLSYDDKKEQLIFYHCTGRGKITMKIDVQIAEPVAQQSQYHDGYDHNEGNRG